MAVKNHPPREGLIFHSDRSLQYCSDAFRSLLRRLCPTVVQSMSRKGNCWDNAYAESFFKTLKTELAILEKGGSAEQIKTAVFEYYVTHPPAHQFAGFYLACENLFFWVFPCVIAKHPGI